MAIWQYDLTLVPRSSFAGLDIEPGAQLTREQWESVDWWREQRLPHSFPQRLEAILPPVVRADADWLVFGAESGTRVDVMTRGTRVEEVRLRLDARELPPETLQQLTDFFADCDLYLVTPALCVLEPRPSTIQTALRSSSAARFVRDPEMFLGSVKQVN